MNIQVMPNKLIPLLEFVEMTWKELKKIGIKQVIKESQFDSIKDFWDYDRKYITESYYNNFLIPIENKIKNSNSLIN